MSRTPDRALAELAGRTLAERAAVAAAVPELARVVVVAEEADHPRLKQLFVRHAPFVVPWALITPGVTPSASIHRALGEIAEPIEAGELTTVLVHDGCWPLASRFLAKQTVTAARRHGSAAPCVALPDAIWVHDDGRTTGVPLGRDTVTVQFPQAFAAVDLLAAYEREEQLAHPGGTVCAVYERRTGRTVRAIAGEARNIEIRAAQDLFAGQLLLEMSDFATA